MNTPYLPQLEHRHAKWLWLVFLSIFLVAPAPMKADTSINVVIGAPPPPRREVIVERTRPAPDYIWVNGYWAYDYQYDRQVWVVGHWERPPRPRAVWVEPRWERRGRGYVFVPGYWNERSAYYRHDSRVDREHRRPYGDYYERDRYYDRRHDEIGR